MNRLRGAGIVSRLGAGLPFVLAAGLLSSAGVAAAEVDGGVRSVELPAALETALPDVSSAVTLTSSRNPSKAGESVTFTALVAALPNVSTPAGTVTFRNYGSTLGSAALDGAGKATLATSTLPVGVHAITASYAGNSLVFGSTSLPLAQSVVSAGGCSVSASDMLCVQPGGRFVVRVNWTNQYDGNRSGVGTAYAITSESGFFTFFSPSNIELVVKVLDGRAVNGSFWVGYGALTDVGYTLSVSDTVTGRVKTYVNPPGNLASVTDVTALPGSRPEEVIVDGDEYGRLASRQAAAAAAAVAAAAEPRDAVVEEGACATAGGNLCLTGARFLSRVAWRNYNDGSRGNGTAVALTGDSGYFWFFSETNVELMMKVLDGRSVNGRFWVLFGSLTDVEFHLTVTDTLGGAERTYDNPPRTQASLIDVNAF